MLLCVCVCVCDTVHGTNFVFISQLALAVMVTVTGIIVDAVSTNAAVWVSAAGLAAAGWLVMQLPSKQPGLAKVS